MVVYYFEDLDFHLENMHLLYLCMYLKSLPNYIYNFY